MTKNDEINKDITHANRVLAEVSKESDRAAIVLIGAEIDYALRRFLEAFLLPPAKKSTEIFAPDSPLGTFSARIEIMYRLALIPPDWHHDLHVFRKVRNEFAHVGAGLDFSNQKVGDLIGNLRIPEQIRQEQISKAGDRPIAGGPNFCADPKSRFLLFASYMLSNLLMIRANIRGPLQWTNPFVKRTEKNTA